MAVKGRHRYAPGAVAQHADINEVTLPDGKVVTSHQAAKLGFVPERTHVWTDKYVQANGFICRAILQRGDAQLFDVDELRELVRGWLLAHDVILDEPTCPFEVFTFNYEPHHNAHVIAERARLDREADEAA